VLHSPSRPNTMKVKTLQSPAMLGDAHTMIQCYVPNDCVFVAMTNHLFNALWGRNLNMRIIWNARVYVVVKTQR